MQQTIINRSLAVKQYQGLKVKNNPRTGEALVQTKQLRSFELECGETINAELGYCVFSDDTNLCGTVDAEKPVVVLLSNISGSPRAKVYGENYSQGDGWFSHCIGTPNPKQKTPFLDTSKYTVVCCDYLGGNGLSATAGRMGSTSAVELGDLREKVTLMDSINLMYQVLHESFGVNEVITVGGSLGGLTARLSLWQDHIRIAKVVDISSPGVLSTNTREFFRLQQNLLLKHMPPKYIAQRLKQLCEKLPGAHQTGFRLALSYICDQLEKTSFTTLNNSLAVSLNRQMSFLVYIHPNGFQKRFEYFKQQYGDSKVAANKIKNWLQGHGDEYTGRMCRLAAANLCRMIADFDTHPAHELARRLITHNAVLMRFGLSGSDDTLFNTELDRDFNKQLKQSGRVSTLSVSDSVNGHDHLFSKQFADESAQDLRAFLEHVVPIVPSTGY